MTRNLVPQQSGRAEAATYIADLTADLASMARRHGLGTLGYLLDMARMEAENLAQTDDDNAASP